MDLIQSLMIALSMYSSIPMPQTEWKEENMKYALCFFPVVGIVTGGVQYIIGNFIYRNTGRVFFAAAMTLIPILISGGIHLDGFMDTMDALGSYGDQKKKLEILKDTHCGAFAVLGLGCYLAGSIGIWSEATEEMLGVIGCSYVISRALSGASVVSFPAARKDGLARTFQDHAAKRAVLLAAAFWIFGASALMIYLDSAMASGAAAGAAIVFWHYQRVADRQFGGVTGDLAGYFLQLCELGMLAGIVITAKVF